MANVINKITGQYLTSVHTPIYVDDSDWIINPSQSDITKYKFVPDPIDPKVAQKEALIQQKIRTIAIDKLILDGELNSSGDIP